MLWEERRVSSQLLLGWGLGAGGSSPEELTCVLELQRQVGVAVVCGRTVFGMPGKQSSPRWLGPEGES